MIESITLSDPTDSVSPPIEVLHVSTVGTLAFISIEGYDEGSGSRTYKTKQTICVSAPALRQALALLGEDSDREEMRGTGKDESRIMGTKHTVVSL